MKNVPQPSMRPVGWLGASFIFARALLVNLGHRLFFRRVRSHDQVASDYDRGEWRNAMDERRWEDCPTLEQYVLSRDNQQIIALVDGALCRIRRSEYYAYRTERLVDTLAQFSMDSDRLIEIGSGAGRNLFALAYSGRWSHLLGLELSATGREVTRLVADRFSLDSVKTEYIDLLNPSSVGFDYLEGATVFSFYCLEQLPAYTRVVLNNLLKAGVRRVIHIEPTPELFEYSSLKDLATISYIWRQDYQRTIVTVAREMERDGYIRVLATKRLHFAPSCRNDPTLVVWEPIVSC